MTTKRAFKTPRWIVEVWDGDRLIGEHEIIAATVDAARATVRAMYGGGVFLSIRKFT